MKARAACAHSATVRERIQISQQQRRACWQDLGRSDWRTVPSIRDPPVSPPTRRGVTATSTRNRLLRSAEFDLSEGATGRSSFAQRHTSTAERFEQQEPNVLPVCSLQAPQQEVDRHRPSRSTHGSIVGTVAKRPTATISICWRSGLLQICNIVSPYSWISVHQSFTWPRHCQALRRTVNSLTRHSTCVSLTARALFAIGLAVIR